MAETGELQRKAFSPKEFAALFGKSQTWGYRQIYAGNVKSITQFGRILIPAAEVEAILKTAGIYDGLKSKAKKTKVEIQKLTPRLGNAWSSFLAARRSGDPLDKLPQSNAVGKTKWPVSSSERQAAMARLTRKKAAND